MTVGDHLMKTDIFRQMSGVNGTGIKVGVISNGVTHYMDAVKTGDLPPDLTVVGSMGDGDEGTAMLEIIHDIAPGAKLYFTPVEGGIESFNDAVDKLVGVNCDIICDDVGWLTDPYFEDGQISDHLNNIFSKNPKLIYISAAGNQAQYHIQTSFQDGGGGWSLFSNKTGKNTELPLEVDPGGSVKIFLEWDDQFKSAKNVYDLYLVDPRTGDVVSKSPDIETGKSPPLAYIVYTNDGNETIPLVLKVKKAGSSEKKTLELFLSLSGARTDTSFLNPIDSIHGLTAAPEVISVAAASPLEIPVSEPFSSQGTITISYPKPEKRKKPDITGIDGVQVSGSGGFITPFYGTSAATPHIAGFIALVLSYDKNLSRKEIYNLLIKTADDLGQKGWDEVYGYGLPDGEKVYNYLSGLNIKISGTENKTNQPGESNTKKKLNQLENCPEGSEWNLQEQTCVLIPGRFEITNPVTISSPGVYDIGKDIESNREYAIRITSSDVRIEGNGHIVQSVPVQIGITPSKPQTGIYIGPDSDTRQITNVTVNNLVVSHSYEGIGVKNTEFYLLTNCVLNGNSRGIDVLESSSGIISGNKINNNGESGIELGDGSNFNTVEGNEVNKNLNGIVIRGGERNQLKENLCNSNYYDGILLTGNSQKTRVLNNTCENNGQGGISARNSNENTIEGNIADDNMWWGTSLYESSGNTLLLNKFFNNFRGINLFYADSNTIQGNILSNNIESAILFQPSGNNRVSENTIVNNEGEGIMIANGATSWQRNYIFDNYFLNKLNLFIENGAKPVYIWNLCPKPGTNIIGGLNISGNYWGTTDGQGYSQNCSDSNNDGFCDHSLVLSDSMKDEYPLSSKNQVIPSSLKNTDISPKPILQNEVRTILREGISHSFRYQKDEAIKSFQDVLKKEPQNTEALMYLSIFYSDIGSFKESIETIDKAIAIAPYSAELWNAKGNTLLLKMQNYEKAVLAYDEAIRINPYDINSISNKGFSLFNLGRYNDAIAEYNLANSINPKIADTWNKLGNAQLSTGNVSLAMASYDKSLELDPEFIFSWNNRGIALLEQGKYEEAVCSFGTALSLDPSYAAANLGRATALMALGRYNEAVEDYTSYLKFEPDSPAVSANLTLAKSKSDTSGGNQVSIDCKSGLSKLSKINNYNLEAIVSCPKSVDSDIFVTQSGKSTVMPAAQINKCAPAWLPVTKKATGTKKILVDLSHAERVKIDNKTAPSLDFEKNPRLFNWQSWADDMRKNGYSVDSIQNKSITEDTLAGYDLLIITQPDSTKDGIAYFTKNEIAAISNFVNSGNGLLLMGQQFMGGMNEEEYNSDYWSRYSYDLILNNLLMELKLPMRFTSGNTGDYPYDLIVSDNPIIQIKNELPDIWISTDNLKNNSTIKFASFHANSISSNGGQDIAKGDNSVYTTPRNNNFSPVISPKKSQPVLIASSRSGCGLVVLYGDPSAWQTENYNGIIYANSNYNEKEVAQSLVKLLTSNDILCEYSVERGCDENLIKPKKTPEGSFTAVNTVNSDKTKNFIQITTNPVAAVKTKSRMVAANPTLLFDVVPSTEVKYQIVAAVTTESRMVAANPTLLFDVVPSTEVKYQIVAAVTTESRVVAAKPISFSLLPLDDGRMVRRTI